MRALLIQHTFRPDLMLDALALNVVFFAAAYLASSSCCRARAATAR